MRRHHTLNLAPLLLGFTAALLTGADQVNADFVFGTPANLGPVVNSTHTDYWPNISFDGLSLYFNSDRPGGYGNYDLWVTTRATTADLWGQPVNLGSTVNGPAQDGGSTISMDQLSLIFWSDRSGGHGRRDLWITTRADVTDPWGPPTNLGPEVNSAYDDACPSISCDGRSLYFLSDRAGGYGHWDIWLSTRPSVTDTWEAPVNLGSTVNTDYGEACPGISANGLALFFVSDRPGGFGSWDLWVTARTSTSALWRTPVNLGSTVNGPYDDGETSVSADGRWLFLHSDRPGTLGDRDIWQVSINPVCDFNGDKVVDSGDYSELARYWRLAESSVDIAPSPLGDEVVDWRDLHVLSEHWLRSIEDILYITWFAHASVKVWTDDVAVYVDPRNLSISPHDATLVLVTHPHGDHYQPGDIAKVSGPDTKFIAPPDVVQQYGQGQAIAPGQTIVSSGIPVTAVPAYNTNKPNHPKSNNWVGFIIELGGKRTYVAGDTDLIPEMQTLGEIDVAFLPAGGTYTMDAVEAAEATKYIQPDLAIPYHWGTSVGTLADAQTFAQLASCAVKVMSAGETISSDNWPVYSPLIAHFALDETEGAVAHDSVGTYDGTLGGDPTWQPAGGKVDGALQLDGDDHVTTPFVLNPADGPFSVFAWIRGGTPRQAIISQTDGTGVGATWLGTDLSQGVLMTTLTDGGRFTGALVGATVVTDGDWHQIGLVWDSSARHLYVDGSEDGADTTAVGKLKSCDGGLNFGGDKTPSPPSLFSGLIDDIRIYNRAITPGADEDGP